MERHDTHALSGDSSFNDHSYVFENKKVNNSKLNKSNSVNIIKKAQTNNIIIKNAKTTINGKKSKNSRKIKNKINDSSIKKNQNINNTREEEKKNKYVPKINNNASYYNSLINRNKYRSSPNGYNVEIYQKYKHEEKKNKVEKEKFGLKYNITYRENIRDTRFNNIQNYIDEENRKKLKENKSVPKLLIYRPVNRPQANLVREIKKPSISFITKQYKEAKKKNTNSSRHKKEKPKICSVINNFCFFTKQRTDIKKFEEMKKNLRLNEKNNSFSSLNSSKSKSKTKRKGSKKKSIINLKNMSKKKLTLFSKKLKPQKPGTIITKETYGNKTRKIIIQDTKRKPLFISKQKIKGINQNIRRFSAMNRNEVKYINLQKKMNDSKLNENKKVNSNNKNNNTKSFINLNRNTSDNLNNIEKEYINFQKFLEEQRIKRNNLIKNYVHKQGINSYNFFYPKEPSPLYSIFKNRYNLYNSLYMDYKNSDEFENDNNSIRIYKKQIDEIKNISRKGKSFCENNKVNEIKEKNKIKKINYNSINKHHGSEKDCPICFDIKVKNQKDKDNRICIKSAKYRICKIKMCQLSSRVQTPNTFRLYKKNNNSYIANISRNLDNSYKSEYLDELSKIRNNFVFLFDYFNY